MKIKIPFGSNYNEYELGEIAIVAKNKDFVLENGYKIQNMPIAYQTYGKLNSDKNNAILICPPLTADQFISENDEYKTHPVTNKQGWWYDYVGSKKAIDTDKYFVICSNVIGGCAGSWGPNTTNPKTGKPYNLGFPVVTMYDMVRAQHLLISEYFKIENLHSVIGCSMGGMQALLWTILYKKMLSSMMFIASSYRHTAQNIAFSEVARRSIIADPDWKQGNYLNCKTFPSKGLSLARMNAHITYLSENALSEKFGRNLQNADKFGFNFNTDFQIESYLKHQGISFIDRFDANSYLYITKAMDYFDLKADYDNNLEQAFLENKVNKCLISLSDDWLFPEKEIKYLYRKINQSGSHVSYINLETNRGHDSFLLYNKRLAEIIKNFLKHI